VDIVRMAVEEPIRWIATNAGRDGSVVVDTAKKSPPGVGYDAEVDDFGDIGMPPQRIPLLMLELKIV